MRALWVFPILWMSLSAHAITKSLPCAPVTSSSVPYPNVQKVWALGSQTLYEFSGGLSLDPSANPVQFPYHSPNEKLLLPIAGSDGSTTLVTQTLTGYALYRWDSSSQLAFQYAQDIPLSENGRTFLSPVIDALTDSAYVYLLSNFQLLTIAQADLLQGKRPSVVERQPGCAAVGDNCLRGAAAMIRGSQIVVIQMLKATQPAVTIQSARSLGAGPGTWADFSSPFQGQSLAYANILRDRGHMFSAAAGKQIFLFGENTGLSMSALPDYPIAIARTGDVSAGTFTGALSFAKKGTFFYKGGTLACRLFDSASSVSTWAKPSVTHFTGLLPDGTIVDTEITN